MAEEEIEDVKKLLVEWKEQGVPEDLINRDLKFEPLKNKCNTLAGIRRAGKTYFMFQRIKNIDTSNTFYINFEDERIINPRIEHLSNLIPAINELFELSDDPLYLFVDEIQNVPGWEKWARRIAEKNDVFLFISGSSSEVTSKEIATSLRGRTLTKHIFPLDFREFIMFKGFKSNLSNIDYSQEKHKIKRLFNEYLEFGGFPEVVLEENKVQKLRILREYFSTIVARDLIERYGVKKVQVLQSFMKLLLNNFSRQISFSKAENWMKSMGIKVSKNTLIEYFDHIRSSFFLFSTGIFSPSVKDRLQYPKKIYVVDNGFATALTERFSTDQGWFYENLVGVELFKEVVSNPRKEIFYWKSGKNEVDFVVKKGGKVKELFQVCSDLNKKSKSREIDNLLKASEELECENLAVITGDKSGEEKIKGKTVKYKPLWSWLLENDRF